MNTWVVVPIKPLLRAKSRLAKTLSAEQRMALAEVMYRQVLTVVAQVTTLTGMLVISRDPNALAIAREFNARTIQESSKSDLNPALNRATEMVRLWRADAVLILPADLPFILASDIQAMIHMAKSDPGIVIAPDRERDGTNALLVRTPGLFPYAYGKNSFSQHIALAHEHHATVAIYESRSLALDIDEPNDLLLYNQMVTGAPKGLLVPFHPVA